MPVGKEVTVSFDKLFGAGTSIKGKLRSVQSDWIIIERAGSESSGRNDRFYWIARDKVLAIEKEDPEID